MSMPPPPPPPPQGQFPPSYGGGYPPAPPGGYSTAPQYAGFGARLGGYLLDGLLYGLLAAVFIIPATVLGVSAFDGCDVVDRFDGTSEILCPPGEPDGALVAAAIALGAVGIIVVAVLYLRALGRTGQTWGRKIVGVKVVGKDTQQPLGVGKAFLRWIIEGIVGQACFLSYLWMLWDKDKQTWHDKIVNSVVIRV